MIPVSEQNRPFSPWQLGAPLYMPAHRLDLRDIANGDKLPMLRSMIFCTEDAVLKYEVDSCIRHLGLCMQGFRENKLRFRFIRARNPEILSRLLDLPHIERIDGFVLPKFTIDNFSAYFDQLQDTDFKVMPTLETREVFDAQAMRELRQALQEAGTDQRILMLRIGGNDLMNLLGIRRPRHMTLYQTPMGHVIAQLVAQFKPYGFALSAPVFEYLDDLETLQWEIRQDLAHGLIGKTAIHPDQVPAIENAYRVECSDYEMAMSMTDSDAPAVFRMHNAMCEVATHRHWSHDIIARYGCFGSRELLSLSDYKEATL